VASRVVLSPSERAAARLVTGPLAHLLAGIADWVAFAAARHTRERVTQRRKAST
jgi:hypothetical protein